MNMDYLFPLSETASLAVFAVLTTLTSFLLLQFIFEAGSFLRVWHKAWNIKLPFTVFFVAARRLGGFLLLGFLPLLAALLIGIPPENFMAEKMNIARTFQVFLVFLVPVGLINYLNASGKDNLAMYPQMRLSSWNFSLALFSSLLWLLYLMGYEFLFRGILLYGTIPCCGAILSVCLNVALYSLAHLPKGRKETLGSIPMGFLLCGITLYTGSFWAAFAVHAQLALTNEYFSIFQGLRKGYIERFDWNRL